MDQDEKIFPNKSVTSLAEKVADVGKIDENEGRLPCIAFGWGKFRPKCLQFLNGPKCFLAAIVVYSLCQGIMALGLITFVLPSIEKRFSFSSKELGIIASSNDITALVLVVFISFYGGYGNKIKWMGGGAVLVGLGSLLFSLPHFIVENYNPVDNVVSSAGGLCRDTNTTMNQNGPPQCHVLSGGEWYYLMMFIVAQLLIGAGLSPLYSLLPAYLDENVEPKSMPLFLGIWFTFNFVGPSVGFAIGGKLLSIYVDIDQPAGLSLTPKDPRWIGAWWLGFVIFGSIILLWSAVILGFPREMPGAKARRLKHIHQGHIEDADDAAEPRLRDILPELKNLLTNWTFLFNSLGTTISALFGSAISSFISKIFQLKFGLDPVFTGYVLTIITMTSVIVGSLVGSLVVRMSSLKTTCKKAALTSLVCYLLIVLSPFMFFIPGCMNSNLAGIAMPYHIGMSNGHAQTTPLPRSLPLKSPCNSNCSCTLKRFSPICGSDSVTYFDACHAGCKVKLPNKTFTNCSCIPSDPTGSFPGTAKLGYCDRSCKNFISFAAIIALVVITWAAMGVPNKTVLLRCVPDNRRAFSIGTQYLMLKALGLLPAPIIFGHLLDLSCRLWQDNCGEKGRCFDYDIEELSRAAFYYGMGITSVASVCYFLSWYLCKPQIETGLGPGAQVAEIPGADSQPSPEETRL